MVSLWLVSIKTVGNQYSQVPEVLHFISHRYADTIIERHWQCQLGQCSINPQVSVPASVLQAPRVETMLKDSSCVFSLIIQ